MGDRVAEFDQFADRYEDIVNKSLGLMPFKVDYFTRVKAAYFLALLRRHFGATAGLSVLDIGCGTGNLHALIDAELGALSGVDLSASSLERASAANPGVDYVHYDGTRLPYADASFDAAITVCVMHHVPPAQWPAFAAEMRRVVRPGGIAAVFEHNPRNFLTRRTVDRCELDADAVLLPMANTRSLLAGAGFGQVTIRSILSIPSFGPLSRRLDLVLGRLGLGAQYFAVAQV